MRTLRGLAALTAALAIAGPAAAADGKDFFNGKTVTYIVATDPGGGYDYYGRLISQYMEKHLPGSKFVVRNMPGAGHIIGANHVYASKPDGLTFGTFNTGLMYSQILGHEGIKFDLRKMSWIGKAASDPRVLVVGTHTGLNSFEDLLGSKKTFKFSAAGIGSSAYNDIKMMTEAFALPVELIAGYEGRDDEMAMRRNEIDGTIGSYSSFAEFVRLGYGKLLLHIGGNVEGVPAATTVAPTPRAKQVAALIGAQADISRLTAGPPGIPQDRLDTLVAAYKAAITDPTLVAEATKAGRTLDPVYGDDLAKLVNDAMNQSPETVALLASLMKMEIPTVTVETPLVAVTPDGRVVEFNSGTEKISSKVSASRTKITLDGKDAKREQLKAGMTCTITFTPGADNEPTVMACKDTKAT